MLRRVGDLLAPVSSTSFPRGVEVPGLPSFPRLPEKWAHVAVSEDLRDVVAVTANGGELSRWVDGEPASVSAPGTTSVSPAFDHFGHAWIGGRDASGRPGVWVLPPAGVEGEIVRVEADWLAGRTVLSVRPAPEGFRAVVLSREPGGRVHLDLAGVARDDDRVPTSLAEPWPVGRDVAVAQSVTWIDDHTLGVVGSRQSGTELMPLVVPLGASTEQHPPITGLRTLVSLGGERGLVGVTAANEVVRRTGAGWESAGSASDVIVPAR